MDINSYYVRKTTTDVTSPNSGYTVRGPSLLPQTLRLFPLSHTTCFMHLHISDYRSGWKNRYGWQKALTDEWETIKKMLKDTKWFEDWERHPGKLNKLCISDNSQRKSHSWWRIMLLVSMRNCSAFRYFLPVLFECSQYKTAKCLGSRIKYGFKSCHEHVFPTPYFLLLA